MFLSKLVGMPGMHLSDDLRTFLGTIDDTVEYSLVFHEKKLGLSFHSDSGRVSLKSSPGIDDLSRFEGCVAPRAGDV